MEWTWLCAVLLLLASGGASAEEESEMCRAWTSETGFSFGPFQCPRRPDSEGVMFCCGSCGSPYCCSSREERLDQEKCVNYGQPGEEDRSTAHEEGEPRARVGKRRGYVQFLPYVYAAIGSIATCLIGWCCYCKCWNEELEMEHMCPSRGVCTHATPPVRGVDATSCSVEESCESLMSPSVLEDTPVVQFGGANPGYHEDEAINVCSAALVHTTGCGPTLETGTNGEDTEQPRPAMDGDESEQPKDDLEQPGLGAAGAVGEDLEEPRPGLDGEDLEQPGPRMFGKDSEELSPGLDGEDLEQPGPSAVGEDLKEPRPGLDGEDLEKLRPGTNGKDLEQLVPRADVKDLEEPKHGTDGEDVEQEMPNAVGGDLEK